MTQFYTSVCCAPSTVDKNNVSFAIFLPFCLPLDYRPSMCLNMFTTLSLSLFDCLNCLSGGDGGGVYLCSQRHLTELVQWKISYQSRVYLCVCAINPTNYYNLNRELWASLRILVNVLMKDISDHAVFLSFIFVPSSNTIRRFHIYEHRQIWQSLETDCNLFFILFVRAWNYARRHSLQL